ncbi:OmpA family protein [Endozoicomonas ascidiicola]|uniref:OmpA family protein n=1 Tax=Endozoicomonas ascidiicola TaxID=1698521 RepID=UPI0008361AC3|nr:OmpA family protein [Endozoicomonas ascidiicola]
MKVHSFAPSVIAIAAAAIISHSATAAPVVDKGLTLSLGASFNDLDSYRGLDDAIAPEVGIGYRYNDQFSLMTTYSQFSTDQKNGDDSDLKAYRLDAFYDLSPWTGQLTPYLVGGIDYLKEKPDHDDSRDDTRLNAGFGLRKALSPNLSIQGDLRAIRSLDYNQTEGLLNVALSWTFGAVAKSVAAAKPVIQKPAPKPVVAKVKDSDRDGVLDNIDLCPETPAGNEVDQTGCEPQETINLLVTFDFDSDAIQANAWDRINKMGEFLQRYPDVKIDITGHTDSMGSEQYNLTLSSQRADAVRKALIEKFGIKAERLQSFGAGEVKPIASNATDDGRLQNRRVVADIVE